MKNRILIVAGLGVLLGLVSQANAGEEKKLGKHEVPKPVLEAFEKSNPGAKDVKFEQETLHGKVAYEVEYKENGKEHELLYSADGTVVQTEEEIEVQSLPGPVTQAIAKAYPKGKIKEAEKVMKPDGTVTGYEVEIKEAGKELELELDTSGKILKTEKE